MEILAIRHGQSEADIIKCHEGRADFPLTELGIRQATLMAEWVGQNYAPDIIVSSTLKRARSTAELLGTRVGIDVEYLDELMEFNNGLIAGLTFEEAKIKYPERNNKKPHDKYYEQESVIEFRLRAETLMSKILYETPNNKRIALISHGGMINMLFRSFLELPINTSISLSTYDTGVHLWKFENEKRQILFTNRIEHLQSLK